MKINYKEILDFWFVETSARKRFSTDKALDFTIRERFEDTWRTGRDGLLVEWESTPQGALALIVLLDQFPRNMFRGKAEAFSSDEVALAVAKRAVERDFDLAVPEERRSFFYMPFMHSERLADQDECIRLFRTRMADAGESLPYALRHREAIARFGRFPARNRALGHADTQEEAAFLAANPSGF